MRSGPSPLSVHLGLMAASLPSQAGGDEAAFAAAMEKMLLGIRQYQLHPYEREIMPASILWTSGEASVSAPGGFVPGQPVLLLVPSMVNRGYIMDLMPGRSLLRWLWGQGINACLLDWGEPVKDTDVANIEGIITQRLAPAVRFLAQQSGEKIHVLGYCMGGTILAGAAEIVAPDVASFALLAAPWDFHAGAQNLLSRVQHWAPQAAPLMAEKGRLPMEWLQTVFASLNPAQGAQKFADFADLDPASEQARIFVAVEDWLNDGVDLPAGIAREPIEQWFLQNTPARGEWQVAGRAVDPGQIRVPVLVMASKRDRLVDFDTAAALHTSIPHSELIDTGLGHIGMMAGREAIEKCWQPIAAWVKKNS